MPLTLTPKTPGTLTLAVKPRGGFPLYCSETLVCSSGLACSGSSLAVKTPGTLTLTPR